LRLLLVNPNTSKSVTDLLVRAATPALSAGTHLEATTATFGVPYIATRAEAVIGAQAALESLAEKAPNYDAAIIGAFGDPGLGAARELFSVPIVGLAEAGMMAACMLGRQFSIVSFATQLEPWYRECVEGHGLLGRCASIRCSGTPFNAIEEVQFDKENALLELCNKATLEDGADVIILAGAPLSGLAKRVSDRIKVPVVDCAVASVKMAEALVALEVKKATTGSFKRPDPKPTSGLNSHLSRWIAYQPE
jgi:allantoin racemase